MKQFTWFPCFIRYQVYLIGIRKGFNYKITSLIIAFYAIGTNHRPIIMEITQQMQKKKMEHQEHIF